MWATDGTPLCHYVTSPPAERGERGARGQGRGSWGLGAVRGEIPAASAGMTEAGRGTAAWCVLGRPPLSLRDISPRVAGGERERTFANVSLCRNDGRGAGETPVWRGQALAGRQAFDDSGVWQLGEIVCGYSDFE